MVILTLAEYGLKGERSEGETGVWLDVGTPLARKICALGVRSSRWVTMHGFAFNVNTDLGYFDHMIPCGIRDKAVTSMNMELGQKEIIYRGGKAEIVKAFCGTFWRLYRQRKNRGINLGLLILLSENHYSQPSIVSPSP